MTLILQKGHNINIYSNQLFLALLVILLIPYVLVSFYSFPSADDFCSATIYGNSSIFEAWIYILNNWSGRYSMGAFGYLHLQAIASSALYHLIPVFLIFLLTISVYVLIHSIFKKSLSILQKSIQTLLFCVTFLAYMPEIGQGLYWFTGSKVYFVPTVLFFLYCGLSIHYIQNKGRKTLYNILLPVLVIFITGCNEISALYLLLFNGILLILHTHSRKFLYFLTITNVVAICISALSPGNMSRASVFPEHSIVIDIGMAVLQSVRFSTLWVSQLSNWLFVILFLIIATHYSNRRLLIRLKKIPLVLFILILFAIPFIAAVLPYLGTGLLGQHRTINVAYPVFLATFTLTIIRIRIAFFRTLKIHGNISIAKPYLAIIFILIVAFTGNTYDILRSFMQGNFSAFKYQIEERNKLLTQEKISVSDLPVIENVPGVLYYEDIKEDSTYWVNSCLKHYYEK